ncbi:hypothetical protein KAR91_09980 [Candidatus Pacearchaeota archaeon]|nr:hypothetical protein [Candidatus Pacearchaeota archaeon]
MARLILPYQRVEDLNGHPLPGAQMYFYESGTVNLKDTYSDEALTTPNTNPVIADSQGQFGDIFLSGAYSVKLDDVDDVTQPDYPAEIAALLDTSAAVLLTGAQTIADVKTFTDRLAVKADTPTVELEENDGSANNRLWQLVSIAEQFIMRVANDARDSFASIFTVDRTDNTVDTVNFLSTNLQHNGDAVLTSVSTAAFRAHLIANQTGMTDGDWTKVIYTTEDFDTNSDYDHTTGRHTPTIAGKWTYIASGGPTAGVVDKLFRLAIYKNGVIYKVIGGEDFSVTPNRTDEVSDLIDMNGSTDYVEVFAFYNPGAAWILLGTATNAVFSGALLR